MPSPQSQHGRRTLGFGRGTGWSVCVREGVIWSVPALLMPLVTLLVGAHWPWLGGSLHESARFSVLAAPSAHLWLMLGLVLLVPAVEELLFRGLIYGRARLRMSVRSSVLLSATVFAVVHPRPAVVPIFCLGVCTALAYERSGSLLAAILVHTIYNTFLVAPALTSF